MNWIHDTNLLKTGLWIKSAIQIFKVWIRESGFTSPPAWICKYSGFMNPYFKGFVLYYSTKDSWRFVRICWIHENRLNLWKLAGFVIHDLKWIFSTPELWSTIWYESRVHFVRQGSNLFGVRIHDHYTIRIHGFAKQIHVFTNLLYDSRNLKKNTLLIF